MNYKLMASNIEKLYDSNGGVLACRNFAVRNDDNKKDVIVPMRCYDDGSSQDGTAVDILTKKSGQLDDPKRRSEFVIEDEQGVHWGESFRFGRILQDQSESFKAPTDYHWGMLRVLSLRNGDRLYYGVLERDDPAKEFRLNVTTGSGSWSLHKIDSDGNESLVSSGTVGADFVLGNLSYGRYVIRVDNGSTLFHAEVKQQVSDPVFGVAYPIWATSEPEGQIISGAPGVYELFFNVYDVEARLVALHHDVSANTVTMYADTEAEVSLETRSFSAVEREDGDIAVFYDYHHSDGEVASRSQKIFYRVFDMDLKAWGSERYTVTLPEAVESDVIQTGGSISYFVHAFDLVQTREGEYTLCFSALLPGEYVNITHVDGTNENNVQTRRTPIISDGFYSIQISQTVFSGNVELHDSRTSLATPPSYRNLFLYRDPDYLVGNYRWARAEVDSVKCEYSPEKDQTVITTIDWHHRVPIVMVGNRGIWEEAAVLFAFDFVQYMFGTGENVNIEDVADAGVETAHTVFGYDGFLYSVVTKKDHFNSGVELFVCDPAMLSDQRAAYIEPGPDFEEDTNGQYSERSFDIYEPFFRQQRIDAFGVFDNTRPSPEFATISKVDQNLTLGLCGATFQNPVALQNFDYDQYPFASNEMEVMFPEVGAADSPYSLQGADNGTYWTLSESSPFSGNVTRTIPLKENSFIDTQHSGHIGYKYHARIEAGNGADETNLTTFPQNGINFEVRPTYDDGVSRWKVQARMRFFEDDLVCEFWDGFQWTVLKTFSAYLASPDIVDYFILVRFVSEAAEDPKAEIIFSYKKRNDKVTDGSSFFEDYRAPAVWSEFLIPTIEDAAADNEYLIGINSGFGSDKANVYQMGWGLLEPDASFYFSDFDPKTEITTEVDVTPTGSLWRRMNDRKLFQVSDESIPLYQFRPLHAENRENVSSFFRWPNGFKYRFSGQAAVVGDRWELSRQVISSTNYLMSSRLHGVWWTVSDSTPVYIWADAQDSNMDKFFVNCFMVQGCNIRKVTLVGKDNIGDPWTELETLDLKRYRLQGLTHQSAAGKKDVVKVPSGRFLEGTFDRGFRHYYDAAGVDNAKVLDAYDDEVVLDTESGGRTETEAVLFGTDGVKVLDNEYSYRFVGIKLDDAETAEGYYLLHTLDFGFGGDVFEGYRYQLDGGMSLNSEGSISVVKPEQAVRTKGLRERAEFEFDYAFIDTKGYGNVVAVVDKVSKSARPVWVYKESKFDPAHVWLCLIDGAPQHGVLVDEDGEEYYTLSLSLRSVS